MNTERECSSARNAKSLISQPLLNCYSINIANLIVDRLFSKIPMKLRFTTKESSNELQQKLIYEEMLKMRLSKKEAFRDLAFVSFLLVSLFLAGIFNQSRRKKLTNHPIFVYSLTPEQILTEGSKEPLREFLKESRFQNLFLKKQIIVESKKLYNFVGRNKENDMEIVFDTSIWIAKNVLSRKIVFKVIQESISRLIQVFRNAKQEQMHVLRELVIDEPVWRYYLEETQPPVTTDIVTTQSQYLRLPYAFYINDEYRMVRSMLWYSTNSNPIQNSKTHKLFDPEHFRFNRIDNHFVWTSEQKKFLEKYNPNAKINIVGAILFKPRQNIERNIHDLNQNIVIFDVTPFDGLDTEVLYNKEVLTDFIQDIVRTLSSSTNTNSSRLLLKPKRAYGRNLRGGLSHSSEYIELLRKLHKLNSIELLKPDVDLYQLVGSASLVIGIPFTSPVILAKELNIPSFFYVPTSARNWAIGNNHDGIAIINGRENLNAFIQNLR